MSLSIRNTGLCILAAICASILLSRFLTVALLIAHAPLDAEPYFYLKQLGFLHFALAR